MNSKFLAVKSGNVIIKLDYPEIPDTSKGTPWFCRYSTSLIRVIYDLFEANHILISFCKFCTVDVDAMMNILFQLPGRITEIRSDLWAYSIVYCISFL